MTNGNMGIAAAACPIFAAQNSGLPNTGNAAVAVALQEAVSHAKNTKLLCQMESWLEIPLAHVSANRT
jgi:hypothetical protein